MLLLLQLLPTVVLVIVVHLCTQITLTDRCQPKHYLHIICTDTCQRKIRRACQMDYSESLKQSLESWYITALVDPSNQQKLPIPIP